MPFSDCDVNETWLATEVRDGEWRWWWWRRWWWRWWVVLMDWWWWWWTWIATDARDGEWWWWWWCRRRWRSHRWIRKPRKLEMNPNGNRYIFGHLSITMRRKVAASKSSVLSSPPSRSESNSTGSTSGSWSQSQLGSHNQDHNQFPTISFPQSGSHN